jgi:drug/metabolite transporter (DMT)-like permease
MSVTAVASYAYMFYMHTPHPLGTRDVLGLLLMRAVCGFMGVFGLYYSVQYLPLSEATVITFLAPIMTCYACSWKIPGETFSRRQQLAAVISLVGVILIARPFSKRSSAGGSESPDKSDSYHHILATAVAFVGVIGAAGAYTSIRLIGKRAHALVSVTYFSTVTTVISLGAMALVPGVPFRFPSTKTEWSLLGGLGVCGFLLQFLLTAGLAYVPPASVAPKAGQGTRATSMVYVQMLFALFYDKVIWGSTPKPISVVGSALILGSAVYVAVAQEPRAEPVDRGEDPREGGFKDDAADEECTGP